MIITVYLHKTQVNSCPLEQDHPSPSMIYFGSVVTVLSLVKLFVMINCYRPQRSWAKVIFSQACVKNSVHGGGSASVHAGIQPPGADPPGSRHPQEQTPQSRHPPEQTPPQSRHHPPGADTPNPPGADTPPRSRLQHTVNERPVRILLECILVVTRCSDILLPHFRPVDLGLVADIHESVLSGRTGFMFVAHPFPLWSQLLIRIQIYHLPTNLLQWRIQDFPGGGVKPGGVAERPTIITLKFLKN